MSIIRNVLKAQDTTDGDGVQLKRVFGYYEKEMFDPFLMLDHADTKNPQSGFPWHPHRGIETITYLIKGGVSHEDTLGNKGTLKVGDIQWMKAASGILHQEMPVKGVERLEMLQFWLNMPAKDKMSKPEYTYMNTNEDSLYIKDAQKVSVIAGEYKGIKGPIQKTDRNVSMFYVELNKNGSFEYHSKKNTNGFIYVLEGYGVLDGVSLEQLHIYQIKDDEDINLKATSDLKLIYAEGTPLNESIAWWGPVVMNTREQLNTARLELQNNTFIKYKEL